jgi:hypothetical protein
MQILFAIHSPANEQPALRGFLYVHMLLAAVNRFVAVTRPYTCYPHRHKHNSPSWSSCVETIRDPQRTGRYGVQGA